MYVYRIFSNGGSVDAVPGFLAITCNGNPLPDNKVWDAITNCLLPFWWSSRENMSIFKMNFF